LTTREQNFYTRELLGVDYNNVVHAMMKTQDERNELMEKAAEVNGTSSEQISAIINEMFL
jgi:guanylate kinase